MAVSERTTYDRRMTHYSLETHSYIEIDDGDLDKPLEDIVFEFPRCGETMLRQLLVTKGIQIQIKYRTIIIHVTNNAFKVIYHKYRPWFQKSPIEIVICFETVIGNICIKLLSMWTTSDNRKRVWDTFSETKTSRFKVSFFRFTLLRSQIEMSNTANRPVNIITISTHHL